MPHTQNYRYEKVFEYHCGDFNQQENHTVIGLLEF